MKTARISHRSLASRRTALLAAFALVALPVLAYAAGAVLAPGQQNRRVTAVNEAGTSSLKGVVMRHHYNTLSGNTTTVTVFDRVVRRADNGQLDFYYRIVSDKGNTAPIQRIVLNSFAGTESREVAYRNDGSGTISPTTVSRSQDGQYIAVDFATPLQPGDESQWVMIRTNARAWDDNGYASVTAGTDTLPSVPNGGSGVPSGSIGRIGFAHPVGALSDPKPGTTPGFSTNVLP